MGSLGSSGWQGSGQSRPVVLSAEAVLVLCSLLCTEDLSLLGKKEGASVPSLCLRTGWQPQFNISRAAPVAPWLFFLPSIECNFHRGCWCLGLVSAIRALGPVSEAGFTLCLDWAGPCGAGGGERWGVSPGPCPERLQGAWRGVSSPHLRALWLQSRQQQGVAGVNCCHPFQSSAVLCYTNTTSRCAPMDEIQPPQLAGVSLGWQL